MTVLSGPAPIVAAKPSRTLWNSGTLTLLATLGERKHYFLSTASGDMEVEKQDAAVAGMKLLERAGDILGRAVGR